MRRNWIDAAIAAWRASESMQFVHEALGVSWDEWHAWTQGNACLLPPPAPPKTPFVRPEVTSPHRVVLIAGAHGLDPAFTKARGTAQSKAWALEQLDRIIRPLAPSGYVLAPHSWEGPNQWAREVAARMGVPFVAFAPNGRRYLNHRSDGDWTARWCPEFERLAVGDARDARRVARDRALANAAAHAMRKGMEVKAHALLSPWAGSVEANSVIGHARREHVRASQHECPAAFSPVVVARIEKDREALEVQSFMRERGPWVYFVQDGQKHVKIGWSSNPKRRFCELQTGLSTAMELVLVVPGDVRVERVLHAVFADYRLQGEWFLMGRRMLSFLWRVAQYRQKHGELTPAKVVEIAHNPAVDTSSYTEA